MGQGPHLQAGNLLGLHVGSVRVTGAERVVDLRVHHAAIVGAEETNEVLHGNGAVVNRVEEHRYGPCNVLGPPIHVVYHEVLLRFRGEAV